MNRFVKISLICLLLAAANRHWSSAVSAADLRIEQLRCEYITNPVGIDVVAPRLSWVLLSETRGQCQTAYRILVASDEAQLAEEEGDLWDSGRVESDQTIHVAYAGKPLESRMRCFWKVKVWDGKGMPSDWSATASWSMGLLKPDDWGAKWIVSPVSPSHVAAPAHNGYQSGPSTTPDASKWVVIDLGCSETVDAVRFFPARPYDLPDMPGFLYPARFKVETSQKADWTDAATAVDETRADVFNPGIDTPLYRFSPRVARYVRLTVTRLRSCGNENFGFALAEMQVLADGRNVALGKTVTALDSIENHNWSPSRLVDGRIVAECDNPHSPTESASMFRKEFEIDGDIRYAAVTVTGLGLYELRINGSKVGDRLLTPEWTRYSKRIQYQTYDVTEMLRRGMNAVGAQVVGGWWASPMMFHNPSPQDRACLLMRLDIDLKDNRHVTIFSDPSWQATTEGPIRKTGIYFGEEYDGTMEMPGWDQPDFNAVGWQPAIVLPSPHQAEHAILTAQPNEPIRVFKDFLPLKMTEPRPGVYVFDMGQNMAGWCRLKATAPAGTVVTLRHAEALNDDGTLYTTNLRTAEQVNRYVWRGGEAVVEPHFTYHGFRYVEVTGLPSRPASDAIAARAFHSATPRAGEFSCSNDLVNRIMRSVEWVQRSNMMSVPTDCPQRDEREGWTGDMQTFSQTAIYQFDMAAFFSKWLFDIRDSQADDGRLSSIAPHVSDPNQSLSGMPGWGDAGTILPWRVYQNYADRCALENLFDAAVRWVEFIRSNNADLLWRNNRGNDCNDWLSADAPFPLEGYPHGQAAVPNEVFATAFFAHSTDLTAKMAKVLGKAEAAAKYSQLFDDIKRAFNEAYVAPDGRIRGDTQAGYALALHFDLLESSLRPKATDHLVESIEKFRSHLSTGLMTSSYVMLELSRNGRHDEAWRLINLRTMPSWGFMVENGGTTMWEGWGNRAKANGYFGAVTNSYSHWALGAVGEWVWRNLAGINPDESEPGYHRVIIRPRLCDGLDWVNADYQSIRGMIRSHWKHKDSLFAMDVEVPVNVTALLYIPAENIAEITESGKTIEQSPHVEFVGMEDGNAILRIDSGKYSFKRDLTWKR
jgi:alpha-L-rhamnosidase